MTDTAPTRRGMILGALSALVLAAAVAVVRQRNVPDLIVQSDESFTGEIRVAIAGEIVAPGTYTLRGDARLADLIAAAGGYTDGAARDVLNPAARVSDGQAYTIPIRPTLAPRAATATAHAPTAPVSVPAVVHPTPTPMPMTATDESGTDTRLTAVEALEEVTTFVEPEVAARTVEPQGTGAVSDTRTPRTPRPPRTSGATRPPAPTRTPASTRAPTRAPTARGTATPSVTATATVNINTASKEVLASLPHIGSALADRIVADRTAHGPYARVDDLVRVPGISLRTVDEIRSRVTVG